MYEKHFTRKDVISMGADLAPCCVSRVWNRTWHKCYNSSFCPLHGEGVGGNTQNPSHCFLPVSAGPFLPPPGLQTAHRPVQRRSTKLSFPKRLSSPLSAHPSPQGQSSSSFLPSDRQPPTTRSPPARILTQVCGDGCATHDSPAPQPVTRRCWGP